jgi:hypothetical protein
MLLAAILINDHLNSRPLPKERPEVDRTVIRIQSAMRFPDRVIIDTTLPTIAPPGVEIVVDEKQTGKSEKLNESFASLQLPMPNMARKSLKKARLRPKPAGTSSSHISADATGW